MSHIWSHNELSEEEKEMSRKLAEQGKLLPKIADIIVKRNIDSKEDLETYLHPSLDDLHNPFLMTDMDKAVNRLNRAIGNKEKILVYGDYDVDGITAVTLVYKYFRLITTAIDYYIPDRYEEGSGISKKAIEFARENGFTIIIALDCGIKANDMVDYATTLGIDFIICDHHMPDEYLPNTVANLNPKLPDTKYPFPELSGCGVGFKLIQAFTISNNSDPRVCYNLLDLVAVSIAADLVPLYGENRILAHHGLKKLNRRPMLGLKSIINVSGLRSKVLDMTDIIFKIGPRINASGRMQSGRESVDLLLSRDFQEAKAISHHIDEYNNQRREIDHSITQEANEIVEGFTDMLDRKLIVVYDPSWHNGVIGIVASRLAEQYNRPAIVMTDTMDNLINGSARSVEGYDIHALLEKAKDLLENFGGHTLAAGFTIHKKNLHHFIQLANRTADEDLTMEDLQPKHKIDSVLELSEITPTLRRQIRKLAPFGPGNEKPTFCSKGVICVTPPRLMGYKKSHLRMMISLPGELPIYQAVAYNQAEYLADLTAGNEFDILYTIEEFNKQGKMEVSLNIIDIHIH
ncbi:single-stranded-DNA-specific exonuclease RecJ [Porphyromonadaceae bacterium W3.11]|nr:single-stranded-DNA-specific exonuclease RecJ [Porphyromonadaceae bacterium W3.11]